MNKEKLIMTLLEKLLNDDSTIIEPSNKEESIHLWKYVLLRCRNAWVHFGKLESVKDNVKYVLSESRRVYYWKIKWSRWISLSELAQEWLHQDSKICANIDLIEITELEWAEIIPIVSKSVVKDFQNKEVYIP